LRELKRVLAVDDSPVVLNLIKEILSSRGYQVETANDAAEALEKYASFKPHVVTLDLALPGTDGYQILSTLKDFDSDANVIMVTASEHASALKECMTKGAVGFLTKPFKPKELISMIEQASDTTKYEDRNVTSLFSLVSDRFQNLLKSMYPSFAVSVNLDYVKVLHNASSSENQDGQDTSTQMTMPSKEHVAFLTEVDGQQIGLVISLIKESDLKVLFVDSKADLESCINNAKEFFNVLNTKVLSQLSEATQLKLKTKQTIHMSAARSDEQFWRSRSALWSHIAEASFTVNYSKRAIPIHVLLWYNGARIFA
jgi:two-component system, chemotaxis family, chemotaxis protein CheY